VGLSKAVPAQYRLGGNGGINQCVEVHKQVNLEMAIAERRIEFYKTESGKSPVEEFLLRLPTKAFRKITWVLQIVRSLPRVPAEYLKKLTGTEEIWEVRAQSGREEIRLLGFWHGGNLIVLTNGFEKKGQKTPPSEIAIAEQRRKDYIRRNPL
jgi:phage-related protein